MSRPSNRAVLLSSTVALAFLVYARTLGNGFVDFDDPENVIDNFSIRELTLANLGHWFTTPLQFMYSPLVTLSYAIDYRLGGLDPTGYHMTNLLLHLANVVLVFFVCLELTKRDFLAHFVSVAFAVHPINVDGVAWIATRSNLLATLFSLGALYLYLRYLRARDLRLLAGAVLLFLLATMSKSVAVVLPLSLFLVDYYRQRRYIVDRRWRWNLLVEKVPFLVIALVMGIVALNFRVDSVNPHGYNVVDRAVLVCAALVRYLALLFVPVDLALANAYPAKPLPWHLYLAPMVLALVGGALYLMVRRWPKAKRLTLFGVGFFIINVLLSQAVLLIDNYAANRYVYLPYVGLLLILGDLVQRLWRNMEWARLVLPAVLTVSLVGFAVLTVVRNGAWRDTDSIMSDSIAKEPDVAFVHNSRGIARYKAGDYPAALVDFERTIELDPTFTLSQYYRGLIRRANGDLPGALADFNAVVAAYPGFAAGYDERGATRMQLGDREGAIADFSTAIELDSYRVVALHNRGLAEIELGQFDAAIADFDQAVAIDPGYAQAVYNRAVARQRAGDQAGACADWRTAQAMGYAPATDALAMNPCG